MGVRGAFCTPLGLIGVSGAWTGAGSGSMCLSWLHGSTDLEKSSIDVVIPVRCAVTGLEGTRGSVCCVKRVDKDSGGATARFAVDGLLGVGKKTGTVGDSGSVF